MFGFTLDPQGTNLPRQYGPWTSFKTIELHRDEPYQGVDVSACLDDIGKHGFHLTAAHRRITHLVLAKNLALVLGGGGATGNAWQVGVIAGLAEAGLDLAEAADLVIGTSSGSTTAVQVRSGIPAAELLAAALSPPVQLAGQGREIRAALPMNAVHERMRAIGAAATSALDLQRAMGAFGLESDAILGPEAAERRRATVAARLPRQAWPDRPMILVAVDAHTGELAAFDRDSGVELVDAVTASTALPGLVPTHNINGARYINGGVRSSENADLAAGYAKVVVLSPFGERNQTPPGRGADPAGQFEGLRRSAEWGTDLTSQVEALRKQGSRVEVITPDADSRVSMGTNQMDPSARPSSARAGYNQGRGVAGRLAEFWW
ncbi:patatin-like phospholipase family protein [Paraburkholderia sp. J12]|uniref:patatin-like phospholipase family protein n=1 Tax=Paraburkholderia sp. J12 TaxID=2805432 RepID=UPI002ABE5605|nr:patatin-like phospholipase family protein [Paraburkholderia sp. J12]